MAYLGYRLKVNGLIISDMTIKKGSYNATPKNRVLASYHDAAGGYHEELAPEPKMEINFSFRAHEMEEHAALMAPFGTERNAVVEYWNDRIGEYSVGIFRVEDMKFPHKSAARRIRYGEIAVKLKEN